MALKYQGKINTLQFSRINTNAIISVIEGNEITIDSRDESDLDIQQFGSRLKIQRRVEETNSQKGGLLNRFFNNNSVNIIGNGNVVINNVNGVTIVNGDIISGGMTDNKQIDMIIGVPRDKIKDLDLSGTTKVTVNAISSFLNIDTSGQSDITVENVNKIELCSSGQSNVKIFNTKSVIMDTSGQSRIEVKSDSLDYIEIDTSGQSNIDVHGNIESLSADTSGISNINVYGKVQKKQVYKSGISNVNIRG